MVYFHLAGSQAQAFALQAEGETWGEVNGT